MVGSIPVLFILKEKSNQLCLFYDYLRGMMSSNMKIIYSMVFPDDLKKLKPLSESK